MVFVQLGRGRFGQGLRVDAMDHGACDALPRGNSHGKPDRLASNDWKESERKQPVEDGTLTSSATSSHIVTIIKVLLLETSTQDRI